MIWWNKLITDGPRRQIYYAEDSGLVAVERRYASGRKAHQTQQDSHSTDAGAGGQWK